MPQTQRDEPTFFSITENTMAVAWLLMAWLLMAVASHGCQCGMTAYAICYIRQCEGVCDNRRSKLCVVVAMQRNTKDGPTFSFHTVEWLLMQYVT